MKITHNKVGQNLSVRDNAKSEKSGTASAAKGLENSKNVNVGDTKPNVNGAGVSDATKVNLSNRAQDIKKAKDIAMSTPDINEEKVARLQKLIDSGEYKTDAAAIAGKMLDEHQNWE